MRWARSKSVSRLVAAVLMASMVPALIAPSARASTSTLHASYSQWLRAQLRVPADDAVERALYVASGSDARSFEQFVHAFFEAYETDGPEAPISLAFTGRDLSKEALLSYLQRRYTRIAGEGVLPRLSLVASSGTMMGTAGGGLVLTPTQYRNGLRPLAAAIPPGHDAFVTSVRTMTPALPQGP